MSAAELTATEEADMADCDGDKVVTMMDVLQEQEDFEEDANAVLGASDEKNCTYPKGYIKRQALYACLTCCPDAKADPTKRAGVCLACSLACHENHELVELYTKRNFCCDCGNPKFTSHPCQFTPNKNDLNENNQYNQNFSGLYCVCHRPYPDPDATFEDEMIQCIVCEDWLHASHLEAKVPPNEQYSEMICKMCMEKNEFLYDYSDLAVNVESEDVDIIGTDKVNGICNGDSEIKIDNKENGDVEMTEGEGNISAEKKDLADGTDTDDKLGEVDSKENTEIEAEQAANTDKSENETTEEKETNLEKGDIDSASKDDSNDNNKNAAGDSAVESKTDEPSTDSISEKQDELADSEDIPREEIPNKEQNSSITDENEHLNSKTDENTENIEEKVDTTKESDKVEPDSAASEPTQDIDSKIETKDEEPTKNIENPESKQETTEGVEKDDLLESIDRIINGDDESSKQGTEKVDENKVVLEEKSSEDESKKIEESSDENDKSKEDAVNEGQIDENKTQTDVDMQDSAKSTEEVEVEPSNENKRKLEDIVDKPDFKKPKLDDCVRPKGVRKQFKGAVFWPCNFRQRICTCNECVTMYKDLSVLFLIDAEDTVSAYEALGKEKNDGRSSQYEIGLQALSSLGRIQQINALTEYNKMRDKLLDFLKSFKDRKEVVKEEDIRAFFAGMKPKREPDGVYFCR